jgi:hypothetical protein
MKKLIYLSFIFIFVVSCSTSLYNYQVFQSESTNLKRDNNVLVYEDSVCEVSYNLYANKGNSGFTIYNKTDRTIIIDLGQSFFIVNDEAFDYYLNRTYTYFASNSLGRSNSLGYSTGVTLGTTTNKTTTNNLNKLTSNTSSTGSSSSRSISSGDFSSTTRGNEISFSEQQFVKIPAKSSKSFFEYNIVSNRLSICDLSRNPSINKPDSLSFTRETSPLVFENRITYLTDSLFSKSTTIENSFYVSKIINMVESDFYRLDYTYGRCTGKKSLEKEEIPNYDSPNNFFIRYDIIR